MAAPESGSESAAEAVLRFSAMACGAEIRVPRRQPGPDAALDAALAAAAAEVRRIEQRYSRYRDDSIVSRINRAAGSGEAIAVDDETATLLDFADRLHHESEGLFDITSGVLRRAWDFRAARPPDAARIEALLPLVGWQQVHWSPAGDGPRRIALGRAGMELDFGGFGKEYAADRAAAVLVRPAAAAVT